MNRLHLSHATPNARPLLYPQASPDVPSSSSVASAHPELASSSYSAKLRAYLNLSLHHPLLQRCA